ncbi:C4-dicarboxylate-specific signal transduction histidine kinase [Sphingomonas zeicaulis]|uniref:sensor histidine kinase n=1 Tax=Sphingomonas zeicaulis TaxID=1632740 RepID=UPI003D2069F3
MTGAIALSGAAAVFAVDMVAGFDVSVAILYAVVLSVAALGQSERGIMLAAAGCMILAGLGWAAVHGSSPDLASVLRLLFATTAICLTCALLVGGKKLQALREALEASRADLLDFNATLEHRVEERTADLLRTEARYASLFEVSNITFAEQDPGEAIGVVAELKRQGVTDLAAHFAQHPALLERCVAAFRTVRVNSACARMLGYDSVEDLVAVPTAGLSDDIASVVLRQLEMIFYDREHIEGRIVLNARDGRGVPIYYTVNRLPDERQLSSHLDLTGQERIEEMRLAAQEELARANRVATVGAFSASIAHELNQPITSMVMDAQTGLRWLRRAEPDPEAAIRILERLARTAQRMAAIVERTRDSVSNGGKRRAVPVDLCALAAETRDLLERDARRRDAVIVLACAADIPAVSADPIVLQQVLVNLLTNAMDAMVDTVGERVATLSIAVVDDMVEVMVSDRGSGIAEEHMARLFQPFFTTKPDGVGMGLQICRSLIEGYGGTLTAANLPEGGALFTFALPIDALAVPDPIRNIAPAD